MQRLHCFPNRHFFKSCFIRNNSHIKMKKEIKPRNYWTNPQNIKEFLHQVNTIYNLKSTEDWDKITTKDIVNAGGGRLLKIFPLFELKCIYCPELSKFSNVAKNKPKPPGYWEKDENIKKFIEKIIDSKFPGDTISRKDIISLGGSYLLHKYSLHQIREMILSFDDNNITNGDNNIVNKTKNNNLTNKQRKPHGFWKSLNNIREFLQNINQDLDKVTKEQIKKAGGNALFATYSLYELKCIAKGENLPVKKRTIRYPGYWEKEENIINFLIQVKNKLGIKNVEDWDAVTAKQIIKLGGGSLLTKFTLFEIKCKANSDFVSRSIKKIKPKGYWNDKNNIKEFIKNIKLQLNLNSPEQWNRISSKDIISFGGSSILKIYPLHELKCMGSDEIRLNKNNLFSHQKRKKSFPNGYWDDINNVNNFIKNVENFYNLNTVEDWNRISREQIQVIGGNGIFSKYKISDIIKMGISIHNNNNNDISKKVDIIDNKYKRSVQRMLFLQIQQLFPKEEIIEDFYHEKISRESGLSVQFDIFIIDKNIAIEYHGKQHYEDNPVAFAPLEMYQQRDKEKENLCNIFGIHLIIIPYYKYHQYDILSLHKHLKSCLPIHVFEKLECSVVT